MILYRTAGPWGSGTGSNLSASQVDGNFYDVHTRVQYLELHPTQPVQISRFSTTGDQFYVYMSDGSVQGPLTLPTVRWNFRNVWAPSVAYFKDDVVIGPDSIVYLVMLNHTSSSTTFDPGANNGSGVNYYSILLQAPAGVIPSGGSPGQVLTRSLPQSYAVQWTTILGLPDGGTTGQILQKTSFATADWVNFGLGNLNGVTITAPATGDTLEWNGTRWVNSPITPSVLTAATWIPIVGQEGTFMVLTNGTTDTTITIPSDSVALFAVGTELNIHQDGTGRVTVTGDAGVTILKHANFANYLLGQYATASIKKTAANTWRLFGLLAAA